MNKDRKQLEVDDQSGGDRTLVANARREQRRVGKTKRGCPFSAP